MVENFTGPHNHRLYRFAAYRVVVPKEKEKEVVGLVRQAQRDFIKRRLSAPPSKEYEERIKIHFSSAQANYHNSICEVLTDQNTDLTYLPQHIGIRRFPSDPAKLMQNRLHAQIEYLRSLNDDSIVFFLDTDILVNKRVDKAFDDTEYSIILTTRPDKESPINGGVFIVSGKRREEAIAFLERVAEIHRQAFQNLAAWGGNQFALKEAVVEKVGGPVPEQGDFPGGVRLIKALMYNYTPPKGATYREILFPRKEYILHFKGERKRAMGPYWQAHIKYKSRPYHPRAIISYFKLAYGAIKEFGILALRRIFPGIKTLTNEDAKSPRDD